MTTELLHFTCFLIKELFIGFWRKQLDVIVPGHLVLLSVCVKDDRVNSINEVCLVNLCLMFRFLYVHNANYMC